MSWGSVTEKKKSFAKIEIIYDGIYPVDARIFFGKYCHNTNVGVLLSDIAHEDKGYVKWLMNDFSGVNPDQDEEFAIACDEVLG